MDNSTKTEEELRLDRANAGTEKWRFWGPYLSERQWGTVREDYSRDGDAWNYLTHDQSRSHAYRWGEDGIGGISDEKQFLCFSIALWNGQDPILKERLFGLTNTEGNHGEDVKEYYFYLANIPSHAYMKYLYKYPQKAFPYTDLIETNRKRTRLDPEYELLDTGIFNDDCYFDVFIEYAKSDPENILIKITIANRGSEAAKLHLLPTLLFRNIWSWEEGAIKPKLHLERQNTEMDVIKASHPLLGNRWLYCQKSNEVLFTENESNTARLFKTPHFTPYVKDGFHEYVIHGSDTINRDRMGTKSAAHYALSFDPQETKIIKLYLSDSESLNDPFGKSFDSLFASRIEETDQFYRRLFPYKEAEDMYNVMCQAYAGLLWNKQYYHYDVAKWLKGDPTQPDPPVERKKGRNHRWIHLDGNDVISMPDKWEYPWFAAWDLCFHAVAIVHIDPELAKQQLLLLTKEWYMSPEGQIPAYEWKFKDVNPPLQAWAALRVYQLEKALYGKEDRNFLKKIFHKLIINFTWWANREDASGKNIFGGGFLGLDNVSAFDRSCALPEGENLEQTDGTGWMGMYCLNLLEISLELSNEDPSYEEMAVKFFEHFVWIADAIDSIVNRPLGLWDEEKGFYYALILYPNGKTVRIYEDSIANIIPLFAVLCHSFKHLGTCFPEYRRRFLKFAERYQSLIKTVASIKYDGEKDRILLAFADENRLKDILRKILDPEEFLSPYGIRSLSKQYAKKPFTVSLDGKKSIVDYEPAESTNWLFGGNSNWRGPVWFPPNIILIEALKNYHAFYGDRFKVECPVGSGQMKNLWEISAFLAKNLIDIFLKNAQGLRPVYGGIEKFQTDPHWKDYILFHEYFHGDNGSGLGASNQTGWTALVVKLIRVYGKFAFGGKSPEEIEKVILGN